MAITCTFCDGEKTFTTQSSLNKHLRNVHKHKQKNIRSYDYEFSNIKCLSCRISFRFTRDLRIHLKLVHNEALVEDNMQFENATDFERWLNNLHTKDNVQYIKREAKGKLYYNCNRSGRYAVKENEFRKRLLKRQGSCKMGYTCTSEIIVTRKPDCSYDVLYHKTHYGHDLEPQHIHFPKEERLDIAAQLTCGISISKVMDLKQNSFNDHSISRSNLVTRQDVRNIKSSFQIPGEGVEVSEEIQTTKDEHTTHIQNIHARHRAALVTDLHVKERGRDYCVLNSQSPKPNIVYVVTKNVDFDTTATPACCDLACSFCKICIHTFSCTCNDFSMGFIICIHIHYVVIKNLLSESTSNGMESTSNKGIEVEGSKEHLTTLEVSAYNTKDSENSIYSNPTSEECLTTLKVNTYNTKDLENVKLQIVNEANKVINNIHSINNEDVLLASLKLLKDINALSDIKETVCLIINSQNTDEELQKMQSISRIPKHLPLSSIRKKSLKKQKETPSKVNVNSFIGNQNIEFMFES